MLDQRSLRYYRTLNIPAKLSKISKYLHIIMLFIIIVFYILCWAIAGLIDSKNLPILLILHVSAWLILPLVLRILIPYMVFRQCINMTIFLLAPGIPLEIIGSFINIPGLLYIVTPLLGVLGVRAFTNSRIKSYVIAVYVFVIEFLFMFCIDTYTISILLIRAILTISPIVISIYFTEKISYRDGVNIYRVASSWIKTLILNDDTEFSLLLNFIGTETYLNTHILLFDSKPKNIVLIAPEIHFGPFRNVGSSSLPYIMDNLFDKAHIASFILHSTGSHERDLVSVSESLSYSKIIYNKTINREDFVEDTIYEPFRSYNRYFESFVIQTNKSIFMIISTPMIGNDDIPYQVQLKAEELGKTYGFNNIVIIDAHNVEGVPINDLSKYISIIMASLSKSSRPCTKLGVGYGEAIVKGYVSGLCSNKIKTIAIDCNNSLYGIVYIYSNNAKAGVREAIRRIAINIGYSDVEVVTADDHSCSGVTYDAPYYAVESNINLLKAAELALTASKNSINKSKVYTAKIVTKNKIVGPKIFELLELAKNVSQKVLRYILLSFLLIYLLLLINTYIFLSLLYIP